LSKQTIMSRRSKDPNQSHFKAPLQGIGAETFPEVYQNKDDNQDTRSESNQYRYAFLSFAGSRGPVTWRNIVFCWLMEMLAAIIITIGVGLGRWYDSGDNVINAIILATFSAISFYVATRLPCDEKLPVHGNGLFTVAYMFTWDVGFWGFWLYTFAQYIGCMIGGGLVLGYMVAGLARSNTHNLIPIPITSGINPTSLTTVVMLEIFFGALWAMVVLLKEYLNTPVGNNGSNPRGREEVATKNHKKAMKLGAFTLFWLVLLGYQFGVYTYSNVGYFGPLFAGTHDAVNNFGNIEQQINLDSAIFTDSVFGTGGPSGRAFMFYILAPCAAGIIAGIVSWAVFMAGKRRGSIPGYAEEPIKTAWIRSSVDTGSSPLSVAAAGQVGLRSPLDPNGTRM
jgi:hypothetical protein